MRLVFTFRRRLFGLRIILTQIAIDPHLNNALLINADLIFRDKKVMMYIFIQLLVPLQHSQSHIQVIGVWNVSHITQPCLKMLNVNFGPIRP